MQVTYIGLSEYFERCIPQAKREGYLFIISLIARYSDAQDLYEKLEKDWASMNDLTGDKILFVFSTPKARKRASFFCALFTCFLIIEGKISLFVN